MTKNSYNLLLYVSGKIFPDWCDVTLYNLFRWIQCHMGAESEEKEHACLASS